MRDVAIVAVTHRLEQDATRIPCLPLVVTALLHDTIEQFAAGHRLHDHVDFIGRLGVVVVIPGRRRRRRRRQRSSCRRRSPTSGSSSTRAIKRHRRRRRRMKTIGRPTPRSSSSAVTSAMTTMALSRPTTSTTPLRDDCYDDHRGNDRNLLLLRLLRLLRPSRRSCRT